MLGVKRELGFGTGRFCVQRVVRTEDGRDDVIEEQPDHDDHAAPDENVGGHHIHPRVLFRPPHEVFRQVPESLCM